MGKLTIFNSYRILIVLGKKTFVTLITENVAYYPPTLWYFIVFDFILKKVTFSFRDIEYWVSVYAIQYMFFYDLLFLCKIYI